MGMDMGRAGMIKQDATMVAFNRSLPSYWRKGYRGNANADIAVQDLQSGEITEITDTNLQQYRSAVHDVHPMWGADGMIYFASERDSVFNLWRIGPKGGEAQQVTRHRDDGVQFPSISPDGKRIVYENEFELWALDVPGGTPRKITIAMAFDPKENDVEVITASNRADGFTVAPSGDYLAVDVHGEIAIVPTEQGVGEKSQVTNSPWRERAQVWSPDGRRIAYVSDESGEEEVWMFERATGARRKLTTHESIKSGLTWSPRSDKLAYVAANRLFEVDAGRRGAARAGAQRGRRLHDRAVLARRQLDRVHAPRRRPERGRLPVRRAGEARGQRDAQPVQRDERRADARRQGRSCSPPRATAACRTCSWRRWRA
jgi:tricorn protease